MLVELVSSLPLALAPSCDRARARDRLGTSLTNVKDLLAHAISEVPYIRPDLVPLVAAND